MMEVKIEAICVCRLQMNGKNQRRRRKTKNKTGSKLSSVIINRCQSIQSVII